MATTCLSTPPPIALQNGKRSSHRENGKVVHRTLGNLSSCSPEEIQAVRLALQHKDQLTEIIYQFQLSPPSQSPPAPPTSSAPTSAADSHFTQGPSVGALILLSALAKELGISEVLGEDRQGKLALWQVIAQALDQGSRLSAVRLGRDLGAATVLDLPSFDEDDLYDNLAWLEKNQSRIESELFDDELAEVIVAPEETHGKTERYILRRNPVRQEEIRATRANKKVVIHARYKGLTQVEEAFRRGKTVELEMRPVHVRRESSTRGHMLVVMLAYQLMKALGERSAKLDVTVAEGLDRLNTYCAVEVAGTFQLLLEPRKDVKELLEAAGVTLPNVIVKSKSRVSTKRKLPQSRPRRSK